jgi:hypothetical protein
MAKLYFTGKTKREDFEKIINEQIQQHGRDLSIMLSPYLTLEENDS